MVNISTKDLQNANMLFEELEQLFKEYGISTAKMGLYNDEGSFTYIIGRPKPCEDVGIAIDK